MEPQVDRQGKGRPNLPRGPRDETIRTDRGPIAVKAPRYGSWDALADAALSPDREAPGEPSPASAVAGVPGTTSPTPPRAISKATRRRERLTQVVLAMRAQGEDVHDIAARLGVSIATITGWLTQHRRAIQVDELDEMLDRIAVPLATENLIHGLIAGDKDYTLETLKGRGALKRHSEGDGKPPTALPELRIVFEAPTHAQIAAPGQGQILGAVSVPKQVTGPVVSSVPNGDVLGPVPAVPRAAPPPPGAGGGGEVSGLGTLDAGSLDGPDAPA